MAGDLFGPIQAFFKTLRVVIALAALSATSD